MTLTRFTTIGLVGHPRHHNALATHHQLYQWLAQQGIEVIIEQQLAKKLAINNAIAMPLEELAQKAQLAIVVGGDGNMLHVARTFAQHDILVIGVNRGNLGFLTDLTPDHLFEPLSEVLNGQYQLEPRFLLEAQIRQANQTVRSGLALNEMVLHPGKMVHMIDFDVYIDGQLAFSQRADGLIIATPTGSTAYALSAGGPIVDPALNVITLVPMFAHSLSARPLIIGSQSHICLAFAKQTRDLLLSCDSQLNLPIHANEQVIIQRYAKPLKLIHPAHYNYFTTLRSKLGWAQKLF